MKTISSLSTVLSSCSLCSPTDRMTTSQFCFNLPLLSPHIVRVLHHVCSISIAFSVLSTIAFPIVFFDFIFFRSSRSHALTCFLRVAKSVRIYHSASSNLSLVRRLFVRSHPRLDSRSSGRFRFSGRDSGSSFFRTILPNQKPIEATRQKQTGRSTSKKMFALQIQAPKRLSLSLHFVFHTFCNFA